MTILSTLVNVLGAVVVLAGVGATASARAADDPKLRADLEELSRRSVFFGHQSVGRNLLDGIAQLAATAGVSVRIVEGADAVAPGTLAHAAVAENGDPFLKLQSFERALGRGPGVDVALVKFCYVDVTEKTDVQALFASYQAAIAALEARYPRTTFVRVTVPLTTVQGGPKGLVKRLLGGHPWGAVENVRREEFNALLRQAVRGKGPLFDLARVESVAPDGRTETFEYQGRRVPSLFPGYTDDGGHLSGEGRLRAARELISVLASAPLRATSASR